MIKEAEFIDRCAVNDPRATNGSPAFAHLARCPRRLIRGASMNKELTNAGSSRWILCVMTNSDILQWREFQNIAVSVL